MKKIFLPGIDLDDEEKIFLSYIEDMLRISLRDRKCVYSQFLDERKIMLAEVCLDSLACRERCFFGGYAQAVRKQLCIFGGSDPPAEKDFPMKAVTYTYRAKDKPSHRDFLGALMSLGLKRSMVGDIVCGENGTSVFVCDNALYDALYLEKAGRVGIRASLNEEPHIEREDDFRIKRISVSSLRLDCILAAAAGMSREKAAAFIRSEGVMLNYRRVTSPDTRVSEGDLFSARGKGKFILSDTSCRSKKDRIFAEIKEYR